MNLSSQSSVDVLSQYSTALRHAGYRGDFLTDDASRLINATDNSIYQVMPQAVLQPHSMDDIDIIMRVAQQDPFMNLKFTARGGGTGTNGQSLNDTLIIDTSRYLNRIIEINQEEKFVRVEPGVVLDQLNAALKPFGLFFPPEVSPGKSATLGGMVATDGCGKGSTVYGKTGDYVLSMRCILSSGEEMDTAHYDDPALRKLFETDYAEACADIPKLPRGLSAYNIPRAFDLDLNQINFNRLFVGSEGSLVLIKELVLRVVERPCFKAIVSIGYHDFDASLRHVPDLLRFKPTAIETIDDHIIALAQRDIVWYDAQKAMPFLKGKADIKALHFVEFDALTEADIETALQNIVHNLVQGMPVIAGYHVTRDQGQVAAISGLRRKCVGLLGNMDGDRRPIPFMEDTAVPPEHLADYIKELRAYLLGHGLDCGMFGHSDAGCLHTRPVLNMRDPLDRNYIRILTDGVVSILKKYRGVLWGEHGKGMRGEYTDMLVGKPYYAMMQKIKHHFDPFDRLNPGKIASTAALKTIDRVPLRGDLDENIKSDYLAGFEKSVQCNGNGMCFSVMPDDTMCPSYRVTRERRYSPKGRAVLLREWLRLKSVDQKRSDAFAPYVKESLDECLGCKACTSTCPIHVNIPHMKSIFLSEYHKKEPRKRRDYALAFSEWLLPLHNYTPGFIWHILGLVDIPKADRQSNQWTMWQGRESLPENAVVIIVDPYTRYFDARIVQALIELLYKMGKSPVILKDFVHGKALYNLGFLDLFKAQSVRNIKRLEEIPDHIPIVGIDPSMTLFLRDEYQWAYGKKLPYQILTVQEYLHSLNFVHAGEEKNFSLFLHCTEKTSMPHSVQLWCDIFARAGIALKVEETGCCGMAGSYGHEREHRMQSAALYDLSWRQKITGESLATGFSCRAQAIRLSGLRVRHPIEVLNELF